MIYVTGDAHGVEGVSTHIENLYMEYGDKARRGCLIITGDCGLVWDKKNLQEDVLKVEKMAEDMELTVAFVDGNHENFDLLNSYPVEVWNGGKTHRIGPHIIHLMRGQVFEIDHRTFFTFGGGTSRDKDQRVEHLSWWKEEEPTDDEVYEAIDNLKSVNGYVDYIITHSPGAYLSSYLYRRSLMRSRFGNYRFKPSIGFCDYCIEKILGYVSNVKCIYCGHEHIDEEIFIRNRKYRLLHKNICRLE